MHNGETADHRLDVLCMYVYSGRQNKDIGVIHEYHMSLRLEAVPNPLKGQRKARDTVGRRSAHRREGARGAERRPTFLASFKAWRRICGLRAERFRDLNAFSKMDNQDRFQA